jgi:hypothetical protein
MRSKIVALVASALLTSTAAGLAPPASAVVTAVCAGQAQAVLTQGLLYPLLPSVTTSGSTITTTFEGAETSTFSLGLLTGACVPGGTLNATGTFTGYCGHGAGQGVTADGYAFGFTTVGALLVVTGGLTGIVHATPSPFVVNNNCAEPGSALAFVLTGGVAKCTGTVLTSLTTVSTAVPLTPGQNLTTLGSTVTSHTTIKAQSAHLSVHACV